MMHQHRVDRRSPALSRSSSFSRRALLKAAATGMAALGLGGVSPIAAAPWSGLEALGRRRSAPGQGVRGGVLKLGYTGSPATLDIHSSGSTNVAMASWHWVETLFAMTDRYEVVPLLAESMETSHDGRTSTLKIRRGVKFHNGETLTSADVIASITRWGNISGLGKPLLATIDEMTAPDDNTVVFKMKEPYGTIVPALCQNTSGCAIYPKSVIDEVGTNRLTKFIGTGPYEFVEWVPDQLIRFKRYDGYQSRTEEPKGFGGAKYAYPDEVHIIPFANQASLVAALRAEELHCVDITPSDQVETFKNDRYLRTFMLAPYVYHTLIINFNSKLTANLKIRQAMQAAMDHEPILQAQYGQGFYRLDPGLMMRETAWHSTVGEKLYNRNDPTAARRLLDEANYDGTPLRIVSTRDALSPEVYKGQLEAAGFKVDHQVMDLASLSAMIQGFKDTWEGNFSGFGMKPDPTQLTYLQMSKWGGAWTSAETEAMVLKLRQTSDFATRKPLFEQIQAQFYEEAGLIKVGDVLTPAAISTKLKGDFFLNIVGVNTWNLWLDS